MVDKPLANFPHRKAPPRERFSGASGALHVLGSACSHSDMRTAKAAQCRFEIQVTDLADMTDHAPLATAAPFVPCRWAGDWFMPANAIG